MPVTDKDRMLARFFVNYVRENPLETRKSLEENFSEMIAKHRESQWQPISSIGVVRTPCLVRREVDAIQSPVYSIEEVICGEGNAWVIPLHALPTPPTEEK